MQNHSNEDRSAEKCKRCCTVMLWSIFIGFLICYVILIAYAGISVSKTKHHDGQDRCNTSPKLLGGLFAGIMISQSVCILFTFLHFTLLKGDNLCIMLRKPNKYEDAIGGLVWALIAW